ncbi:type II CRISPR-associated endonuclease Cas1 [Staphylococcus pettenkoferi]|uniref:CRISPR-associated endonuclease Cas1 n=1 Tax=Staphylococcus pettenkoferi TaxID=170573 RepID=A0A9Q4H437_9STAP|nr:type II CRISPR-associated endonuclease Cas1 [Staphylococcus pettenkoferi]MCY1569350.1 type II CRISPR-associated endonuclease Cas1 [Staphylococcus pettenkoferi]MCY1576099.1 type II CRISPR-associated endonuclease Cas1 [Staphylococcus pettenkoferi]MCY1593891.1 type II CRISPR-associated endonuclease Cas1 [Staphylococcus pettenkoferi]MCY1617510.1 type II CRISPR-associated endonuclease Cas1 [Staphylococcus pettenkoferi]
MAWRIVYASEVDKLALNLNSLKVNKGDLEVKIPLNDIFAVVVEDLTVTITSRLLVELSSYNILVIFCNQKHLPECVLQPISGHYNQYLQMKEQLEWDSYRKSLLWENIIKQKIANQTHCLKFMEIDEERVVKMQKLKDSVERFDEFNVEGQAAKYYFNSLFYDFKRDNDELIENAVLNYGYTILNAAVARTIVAKGLIPALGIFHIGGRNHYNLASDLLEPLRPLVDLFMLKHPPEEFLTKEYRLKLVNLMHARVEIDGKMQTVIRAIEIMIQSVIDYFRNDDVTVLKLPKLNRYEFYEL